MPLTRVRIASFRRSEEPQLRAGGPPRVLVAPPCLGEAHFRNARPKLSVGRGTRTLEGQAHPSYRELGVPRTVARQKQNHPPRTPIGRLQGGRAFHEGGLGPADPKHRHRAIEPVPVTCFPFHNQTAIPNARRSEVRVRWRAAGGRHRQDVAETGHPVNSAWPIDTLARTPQVYG